ncbi:hypothetical protein GCM10027074_65060 [Streptomyces deserti]
MNGSPDPQAGDMDVTKLTSLGTEWGQFNIEKYAALRPDLLVSNVGTSSRRRRSGQARSA